MPSRPVAFAIAAAAGTAILTAASAPAPLYPTYQRLWHFSTFTLTVVFAVYVATLLVALLAVGALSDRVGRRLVASASLLVLAVGMLVFAGADGTGALIAARVLQGLAVGAATGTLTAMIVDAAPTARSGSIVSSAVPSLGIAVGAVLAGGLVEYAPLPRQLVFWVLAAVDLALAALVWRVGERSEDRPVPRESLLRSLLPTAGLPREVRSTFLALLPLICAAWALAGLYLSLGSSVIGGVLGVQDHFVVGVVLAVFFVAGTAGTALASTVPERLRSVAGAAVLAAGVGVTTAATLLGALPLYAVGSAIAGIGYGATFRHIIDALGREAPGHQRGQVFATMYIVSYAAFSVPALGAGLAAGVWGLQRTAVAYGALVVALVAVAALVHFHAGKRTAAVTG
ncbi:MFS transporter [Curtobacterium sp. MCBD17_019]|uniref:MFS transporter n=1 Tax=Curtobacterium sp. MCBD17_019 TaxID=2175669 RepID=UPI000DAAA71E|nr:MFS transporter [Curtobacterium sp. MCBD17_019]PZE77683.1 MFS transporter [Curtobacterium sp. MCBD17_019]